MKKLYKLLLGLQFVAEDFTEWGMGFLIYSHVVSFEGLNFLFVAIVYCFFMSWFCSGFKRRQLYHDMNL